MSKIKLNVYRDHEDGAWIADISEGVTTGNEWSGRYWSREEAHRAGIQQLAIIGSKEGEAREAAAALAALQAVDARKTLEENK